MKKLKLISGKIFLRSKVLFNILLVAYSVTIIISLTSIVVHHDAFYFFRKSLDAEIEKIVIESDLDNDGVLDLDDILIGARQEVENKTAYKSEYYEGGYPPESEGVCTDLVWRALLNAGYNLKDAMDKDILENIEDYPSIDEADPNIDFRRVRNQKIFYQKYFKELTTEIIPYDIENLEQWQGGDIVVLQNPDHVAIVSDKRRKDGVPYIIHNESSYPKEESKLISWYWGDRIIGHYRFEDVE